MTNPILVWNYHEAPLKYQFKVEGKPVYVVVYEKEYFEKHGTNYLNTPTDKIGRVLKFDTKDEIILIGISREN